MDTFTHLEIQFRSTISRAREGRSRWANFNVPSHRVALKQFKQPETGYKFPHL